MKQAHERKDHGKEILAEHRAKKEVARHKFAGVMPPGRSLKNALDKKKYA